MIDLVRYLVIAAAGVLSVGIIAATVAPQWRRIASLVAGRPDMLARDERWRRVHLAADRRPALPQEDR